MNMTTDPGKTYQIGDPIHGPINIFPPIGTVIDTPPMQRLRRIKQLSFVHYVYPSAIHDRFAHSLGVYHLAHRMMVALSVKNGADVQITEPDVICVSLAALYHDAGHGPFSHFYEFFLEKMEIEGFKHEEMSCKIFDYYYENDARMKAALDDCLDERDRTFIKELIDTPKSLFDEHGQWQMKGRGIEKAFLYEIVNNPHTGLDVDKVDYILRDSTTTNVGNKLRKNEWERVQNYAKVIAHPDKRRQCIAFPEKTRRLIKNIFEDRAELHEAVYQHKATVSIKFVMLEVLRLANDHLDFYGKDGKPYKLTNAFEDVHAFMQMDDNVTSIIKYRAQTEENSNLVKAAALFDEIERREIPKLVKKLKVRPDVEKEAFMKKFVQTIQNWDPELSKHMHTKLVSFDQGKGVKSSPIQDVVFYDNKNNSDGYLVPDPGSGGSLNLFVYVDFEEGSALKDSLLVALKSIAATDSDLLEGNHFARTNTTYKRQLADKNMEFDSPPIKRTQNMHEASAADTTSDGSSFENLEFLNNSN